MSTTPTTPTEGSAPKKRTVKVKSNLDIIKGINDSVELLEKPNDLIYVRNLIEERIGKIQSGQVPVAASQE
jgi:hypothetical protein